MRETRLKLITYLSLSLMMISLVALLVNTANNQHYRPWTEATLSIICFTIVARIYRLNTTANQQKGPDHEH